jgi:hypothetical protein
MKTKILTLCVLLVCALVALGAQPQQKTWEYKVITGKAYDQNKLNAAGAEGWELASCASGLDACIFKRAR